MIASGGGSPTPPGPTPPDPPSPGTLVFYDLLVFDGTAYIDTDIVPGSNATYYAILGSETIKGAQRIFMVPTGEAQTGVILASATNSTTRNHSAYYAKASAIVTNKTLSFSYSRYSTLLTPKRVLIGSTPTSYTKGSSTPSGPLVLGSRTQHDGQAYTGSMGIFRVYGSDAQDCSSFDDLKNYTPQYTLRPCTYNDEAGMWCVETSKFYGNTAGAGTLLAINNE